MVGIVARRKQVGNHAVTPVIIVGKHRRAHSERSEKRKENQPQQHHQDRFAIKHCAKIRTPQSAPQSDANQRHYDSPSPCEAAAFNAKQPTAALPAEGLEPTRSCDHWILSPARLPIPPRRRKQSEATKPESVLKCSGRGQAAANFLAARTKNLPQRFPIAAREAVDCR